MQTYQKDEARSDSLFATHDYLLSIFDGLPILAPDLVVLTHWGRVTHICVSRLTIIDSDNGLPPDGRQAIIWTNAGILLIGPLGTNVSENLIEIHAFSFKQVHLKMASGKWRPFCLGLNVLTLLRPRQNGRHFAYDIFKWIFLNENVWIPIKISLKFVPQCPINNIPALV